MAMRKLNLNPTPDDSINPATDSRTVETSSVDAGVVDQGGNTPLDGNTVKTDNQAVLKKPDANMKNSLKKMLPMLVLAVIAGVGTGFGAHKLTAKDTGVPADGNIQKVAGTEINKGDVFGSADENTFKDSAVGYLELGGLEGEGSHKLLRPGGGAQTVYLTSTVTDLDKLEGMEVQIWGETFKGQKAGWLMDVGRIKVIETEGKSPVEE